MFLTSRVPVMCALSFVDIVLHAVFSLALDIIGDAFRVAVPDVRGRTNEAIIPPTILLPERV